MKWKKAAAILMVMAMTAGLAACGSESSSDSGESEGGADGSGKYVIGICQQMEHPSLDDATAGFQDACKELFGEDNVEFDVQNAQGEQTMCSTIMNNFVSSDVDLILANATLPLQTAAQATADIPILGTSVTDYGSALGIDDWTGTTGVNVSGTSDLAPIAEQEDVMLELLPDVKTVGILYCSAESNSKYQAEMFEKELEEDGVEYKEYTAADSNEIQSVVTNAVQEVDAIYIPTDNTMAANPGIIDNICRPAKIPVVASEQGTCSVAGIATLCISYYELGYTTGEMAYDILANGEDITTMEVRTAPEPTRMYNPEICEELGITVPEGYEPIESASAAE